MSNRHLLLAGFVAAFLFSLAIDYSLTRQYGGVDLRDKVVGARSLMAGRSMYFAPWKPGEPDRFADPMVAPGAAMTRYTGTPFQALLLAPLGTLPFGALRVPWLLAQYGLLLVALLAMHRAFASKDLHAWVVSGALLLVLLASTSWRLHVERGQVYVLFAGFIAILFWASAKGWMMLAGAIAAALVLCKPTYAFLLLPLALRLNGRLLLGGLAMIAAAAGAFALLPNGLVAWSEYQEAMRAWSGMVGLGSPPSLDPGAFDYPASIEGLTNLREHHRMEFENGSVAAVLIAITGIALPGWLPWMAYAAVIGAGVVLLRKHGAAIAYGELLLIGFCGWTVLMMLLPVPRFDYQVVHWVAPMGFALHAFRDRPFAWDAGAVLAAALVVGAWSILPVDILLAEALLLVLCGWLLLKGRRPAMPESA